MIREEVLTGTSVAPELEEIIYYFSVSDESIIILAKILKKTINHPVRCVLDMLFLPRESSKTHP